jgi:MFS family permease
MRRPGQWFYAFMIAFVAAGSASLLLPLFATTVLGGTVGQIGLMASIASLAGVPFSILWGRWSELFHGKNRFGRQLTLYFRSVVLTFIGSSAFFVPLPIFFRQALGMDGSLIYAVWIVHPLVSTLFHSRAGGLAERLGNRRLQRLALAIR